MITFYSTVFFIFGACIGSFLNVVILRTHEKKTLDGRSRCPHCKHELQTLDLIPIFSYLALQGKCRYCKHKLSIQYPLIELTTAILFTIAFLVWGQTLTEEGLTPVSLIAFLFSLFLISVLIVVTVYDLRWGLIPDKIVVPASLTAVFYTLFKFGWLLFTDPNRMTTLIDLGVYLLLVLGVGGFFATLIVGTKGKGMGGGDLKLSVFIALALGFPLTIIALLLAFLTGAVASVILLLSGKKGFKSQIPFGPFLALGALLSMILGTNLWSAYLQMLGFN